ncbi:MAG: hypothetical protein HY221_00740, partial [Candidatus Sungbacteria bacterium]|nr:hypothetical protein [Candidatus Sungbacteria bacterium]
MRALFACVAVLLALLPEAGSCAQDTSPAEVANVEKKTTAEKTVQVEGVPVVLFAPDGACVFEKENAADAKLLEQLQKSLGEINQMLLVFAGCHDLDDMRSGTTHPAQSDYGQVLFTLDAKNMLELSRKEFVSQTAEYYRKNIGSFEPDGKKVSEAAKALIVNKKDATLLGVVYEDSDMVQLGLVQTMKTTRGVVPIVGVITNTKAGVPIGVTMYHIATEKNSD